MRTWNDSSLGWCLVLGLAACGDVGGDDETTAADTETASATESASQTATASATESATESESESATDTDSDTEPDPTDPTEGTTAGETTGETGEETGDTENPVGGWCDIADDECGSTEFDTFECGGAALCDTLVVRDPSLNEFDEGPITFDNADAATCILESLRDDAAATHTIEVEPGQQYWHRWTIEALGDGTIVLSRLSQDDKCYTFVSTWALRRDDAHFEACLTAADDAAMYTCLIDPVDPAECVDAPAECP